MLFIAAGTDADVNASLQRQSRCWMVLLTLVGCHAVMPLEEWKNEEYKDDEAHHSWTARGH